jgi:hypothetical protein
VAETLEAADKVGDKVAVEVLNPAPVLEVTAFVPSVVIQNLTRSENGVSISPAPSAAQKWCVSRPVHP